MAKVQRIFIRLKCGGCGKINYTTKKHRAAEKKLELKKFCPKCRKHTPHREVKI